MPGNSKADTSNPSFSIAAKEGLSSQRPRSGLSRFTSLFLRLGVVSTRWPRRVMWVLILLSVIVATGLTWLKADDALDSFLKAKTPDYQTYERLMERFPAGSLDVFVAIESDNLFSTSHLHSMRELTFELLLADAVDSVVSIFSLRTPLQANAEPASIIPDDIPTDAAKLKTLEAQIDAHPLARGRLISKSFDGRRLALFLVALNREEVRKRGLLTVISELKTLTHDTTSGSGLSVGLAGIPTMKSEVIKSTRRDAFIFNALGLLVGAAVCAVFFRRWRLVLIANIPASLSLVWCLGLFGWVGLPLDPLLNSVKPLVLVVTFNNAMHLLFAICRNLDKGASKQSAILKAVDDVAPAIALTSITTMIALFSLSFSSSPLIQSFGLMAGVCILVALSLSLAVIPMLASLILSPNQSYLHDNNPYNGVNKLDRTAAGIATAVAKAPRMVVAAGLVLTVLFALAYFQLEPRYRLSSMLPDHGQAAKVTERIESRMGGLFPLNVMIEWPNRFDASSDEVRSAIRDVHAAMEKQPAISKVNSMSELQSWAESGGLSSREASDRLLEIIPASIQSRFINETQRSSLVSGYVGDLESKDLLRLSRDIDVQLATIKARHPEMNFTVSGLSYIAAKRSTTVISGLSIGLLGAVAVVIVLIGVAFQSFAMAGLSIIPNLFAIFATGTWLVFINGGLDYATIVGLTVAFGLAVDDTVHVLNRYQLELRNNASVEMATTKTLRLIGVVLILTTIVLLGGLSVTQLSAVPPTRQFGIVCIVTLFFALVADLVILPALILTSAKMKRHPFAAVIGQNIGTNNDLKVRDLKHGD